MTYTLRFLSEKRFGTFVRWLSGTGQGDGDAGAEATCVVTLNHPEHATPKPFYAKFYQDLDGRSRALANEIAGYVFADRYGLPQPPKACLARLPLRHLDLKALDRKHQWLKDWAKKNDTYPVFCTEAMNSPTPWHHYGEHAVEAMKADVRQWADHGRAMAFDDIIANLDRHLNNLLRIGAARYALIDHGRLVVTDGHWQRDDLNPDCQYRNRLLDILYDDPAEAANGMVAAAEQATALLTGTAEVHHWISHILQNEGESRAFDKFVQARTIAAPERIAKRYALC